MTAKTPINDFIEKYCSQGVSRFHMPGHKGKVLHGSEPLDITEIKGADYLYESDGIIAQSEKLTSEIFGTARTLYSTEGSSLSIKAMLNIIVQCRKNHSRKPVVIAPRNVHKAFINGCCLLDIDVKWVYPETYSTDLCSSAVTAKDIESAIVECDTLPDAVYITSPDYIGNMADIKGISSVCRKYGLPLLVDNAHGAYLKFLESSLHPTDLGADICTDSAHKTLPVYTGGSYLHISKTAPKEYSEYAKSAMSLFASTSPSYLIMESLDKCCGELQGDLPRRIRKCAERVALSAEKARLYGWDVKANEPLKLCINPQSSGYSGEDLAELLRESKIECEYSDVNYVVLMCSPYNSEEDFTRLENTLKAIPQKSPKKTDATDTIPTAVTKMSIREAYFSPFKTVHVDLAEGKICGQTALSCQPSIPVVVSGELITKDVIKILKKYGILTIDVL